mmetsp:Transcript_65899/g.181990  ORF Transcript_65899/g.181990 Transcript_65899/m.181990 type:complete len:162 (+) Transcript_65899:121-606(+)|eukprot:CAMPEP_0176231560 /NCGR_PEP_ID=MMETSP0121_2-20121125/24861_1 /TAXON_ID=160619 /ORGANISM="Kryptoperidinium foliaceum, Strain CCMP 1326" /LENGTH=161 /DNA_ID=CAMNT_0017570905 /DNA_START=112 /DNA_END=597 /DNA_ORIENTATION=-
MPGRYAPFHTGFGGPATAFTPAQDELASKNALAAVKTTLQDLSETAEKMLQASNHLSAKQSYLSQLERAVSEASGAADGVQASLGDLDRAARVLQDDPSEAAVPDALIAWAAAPRRTRVATAPERPSGPGRPPPPAPSVPTDLRAVGLRRQRCLGVGAFFL